MFACNMKYTRLNSAHQTVLMRISLFSIIVPAPAKRVSTSVIFFMQVLQVPENKSQCLQVQTSGPSESDGIMFFKVQIELQQLDVYFLFFNVESSCCSHSPGSSLRPISNMQVRNVQFRISCKIDAARLRLAESSGALRRSSSCCVDHPIT